MLDDTTGRSFVPGIMSFTNFLVFGTGRSVEGIGFHRLIGAYRQAEEACGLIGLFAPPPFIRRLVSYFFF